MLHLFYYRLLEGVTNNGDSQFLPPNVHVLHLLVFSF